MGEREIIFEIRRLGAFAKVCAIDVASGVEVSVAGPAAATDASLREAALAKLDWVLKRRRDAAPRGGGPDGGGVTA